MGGGLYLAPVPVRKNGDFCESSWSNFNKAREQFPYWFDGYRTARRREEESARLRAGRVKT